ELDWQRSCLNAAFFMLLWSGVSHAQRDCTGVECQPLDNCIDDVLEPGECCATCLQHGCTCEGYQYYDCVNVGFVNGKVPEGQSYFVDFGSTECSCPKGGGKISCQFMLCPELPPNCIDAVVPADGCPQCGRIGCLHEGQKYVAGHTFHMPPCKVCHCPNAGGELMCYQLPDCNTFALNTVSPMDTEDNEPERHYDDPYSSHFEVPSTTAAPPQQTTHKEAPVTTIAPLEHTTATTETPKQLGKLDRRQKGKQGDKERNEHERAPHSKMKKHARKEDPGNSIHLDLKEVNLTEPSSAKSSHETHEENAFPKVKFSATTSPPVALKEDRSQSSQKQSQTLYRYHPEEDGDPNSIHANPRLPEGSTKELIESCCGAGQQWAIDNGECTETPISGADGDICRIAQKQCCISTVKENSCLAGMIAAKEGDACGPDESDTCGGSSYKQCCDCCNLGLRLRSEGKTCESNINLGYPCSHVMLSCCEGGDHFIHPEIKKHPEPSPTATPEKISEMEDHNEALSISNEAELSNNLPGDDLDECLLYGGELCQHLCINTVGSYKCSCFPEFTLQEDGTSCSPGEELPCGIWIYNGPCKHICSVVEGNVVCSCLSGYTIMADGISCEDINECVTDTHTCQRREHCVNTMGSFKCLQELSCQPGYELKDGECVDIDECERGTHSCKVNFVCQNTEGSFYCESKQRCMDGFLQDPEGNCVDINECTSLPEPCKPGFNCINTVGSYTCQRNMLTCSRGYHSNEDGTRCVDVDECQTGVHRCGEGQICHNLPGAYRCDCKMGYQYDAFSRSCIDINECWNYPGRLCQHTCENTPGSYHCTCSSGFHLSYDGKHCEDVNECDTSPCSQECANVYGSYQCYCRQGFQLAEDGHSCKDIDECTQSAGILCTFRCVNVPGSYQCACPEQGYTMAANGRTCRDIDECAIGTHNCSAAESCYNIQGSFRCLSFECPSNYRKVSDMRCERISCFNYLNCQNTPVRITYYQLNFQTNIMVPAHIFRIGPSPAYAGDNIILTINKGNEENYFSTRRLNSYTGIVYLQRQVKEPKDFLLDVEMKLWRQGTYTTFLAKIYIFITAHAY
uniref:Fibulin-2 n=1 Tax=Meleagris gallopavo TaxID=9103 RepID=A0A803XKG8_MELGA